MDVDYIQSNSKTAECAVCFEDLLGNNVLECGHSIHSNCIIASGKAQCPLCRADLPSFRDVITDDDDEQSESTDTDTLDGDMAPIDYLLAAGYICCEDIPLFDDLGITNRDPKTILRAGLTAWYIRCLYE